MASFDKIREAYRSGLDTIRELDAVQQLKAKWEELDPQSRTYLRFAGYGGGIILGFFILLSVVWSVHSIKKDYHEKQALLTEIQTANNEIRKLREGLPASVNNPDLNNTEEKTVAPWAFYFESIATAAGIDKSNITVAPERAGTVSDQSKEALIDINVKHISIKQLVRFGFNLENGARPVKLRNLSVDTKADPEGYMDAEFSVSAFNLVTQK